MFVADVPYVSKPVSLIDSFGFKFFNKSGDLAYESVEVTWNQVDSFVCPGGASISKLYPVIAGREVLVVQSMMNAPPIDRRALAHQTAVSGTTVSVWGGSEQALILVLMR